MKTVQGEIAAINRMKQEATSKPWGKCQECGKELSLSRGDGYLRCKEDLDRLKSTQVTEKSMKELKDEILLMIGFRSIPSFGYSGSLNRDELKAVHAWISKYNA